MDYGMPRFDNMPSFKTEIAEVLSPTNPFGVKAGGEGGTTPAPALIMSAIDDALASIGEPTRSRCRRRPHRSGKPSGTRNNDEHDPEKWVPVFGKDHDPLRTGA